MLKKFYPMCKNKVIKKIYSFFLTIKGKKIFKSRREVEIMGGKSVNIYDGEYIWLKNSLTGEITKEKTDYNPYETTENLKDLDAQYTGKENIDGYTCYVLRIKDMSKFFPKEQRKETTNKIFGNMWIDSEGWIIRKIAR